MKEIMNQGDEHRASVHDAIKTMRNLGVSLNEYDSAALELLIQWSEDALSAVQPVAQEAINQIMQLVDDYGHVCAASVTAPSVDAGDTSKEYKAIESALTAAIAAPMPQSAEVTDEQIVATAREKQKRLAHWDYDDLVSFAHAVIALAGEKK